MFVINTKLSVAQMTFFPLRRVYGVSRPQRGYLYFYGQKLGVKLLLLITLLRRIGWCCLCQYCREIVDHLLLHCDVTHIICCEVNFLSCLEFNG